MYVGKFKGEMKLSENSLCVRFVLLLIRLMCFAKANEWTTDTNDRQSVFFGLFYNRTQSFDIHSSYHIRTLAYDIKNECSVVCRLITAEDKLKLDV